MTRGRKPKIEPSAALNLHLPQTLKARIDLLLYSELEGRVPVGAYQRFFQTVLATFFSTRELDLSPYLGTLPGTSIVRGRPEVIDALERTLNELQGTPCNPPK